MRSVLIFFVVFGLCGIPPGSGGQAFGKEPLFPDLRIAKIAYRAHDYEKAVQHWRPLAAFGLPEAQTWLGIAHLKGQGTAKDPARAFALFSQAARQKHRRAMFELARLYESGTGTTKDLSQAELWYRRAQSKEYARADYALGQLYARGKQTEPPPGKRAAKKKSKPDSKTDENAARAAGYFLNAIKQGYFRAGYPLGRLYEAGRLKSDLNAAGTTSGTAHGRNFQNSQENAALVDALAYFELAAQSGHAKAAERAEKIAEKLSEAQINAAGEKTATLRAAFEKRQTPRPAPFSLKGDLKLQTVLEENRDLGSSSEENATAFLSDAKLGVLVRPDEDVRAYAEGRALWNSGLVSADTDEGSDSFDQSFLELRQLWLAFDDFAGHPLLSMTIGRQRFRETRNIWWNRDFDALRLGLRSTLAEGFVAVGQNISSYRVGNDDSGNFDKDEQERLRVLGEFSRQWQPKHFAELRFLFEKDYSGQETVGQIIASDDLDSEDAKLLWLGARLKGRLTEKPAGGRKASEAAVPGLLHNLGYRADLMGVYGEETLVSSSAGPAASQRTITGTSKRDVGGWAIDSSLDFEIDAPLQPTLTIGYAYASGDKDPGTSKDDRAFRQTGLEGNSSRFPEPRAGTTLRNFGEVLRPELSNLHILTLGANLSLLQTGDTSLNYFRYRLDQDATSLRSSRIRAPLNGTDKDVGQALDLVTTIGLNQTAQTAPKTTAKINLGGFRAGDAYGAAEGEYAFRVFAELRFKF